MRAKTYIISDTHFFHEDIIKLSTRRNMFTDVEDMNLTIIVRINSKVRKGDRLIILGDFLFSGRDKLEKDMQETIRELLNMIKCDVEILWGNHDPKKKGIQWFLDCGFTAVYTHPIIVDNWFILSHEPIGYLTEVMPYVNIHGHTHDECFANPQRFNVSWEILDGYPIDFNDIKEHYAGTKELDAAVKIMTHSRHDGEKLRCAERKRVV